MRSCAMDQEDITRKARLKIYLLALQPLFLTGFYTFWSLDPRRKCRLSHEKGELSMTVGMVIWLFILTLDVNLVSAINIYSGDKTRCLQNYFGKMLVSKAFRFFIKYDRKTTLMYLKTFIANILLFVGALVEIVLFVLSLTVKDETFKIILSSGVLVIGLLIGAIITGICRYKFK